MPTPDEIKKKFYEVDLEPEYVRYMQGLKARFHTIAMSDKFKAAAGKKFQGGLNAINRDIEKTLKDVKWKERMSSFETLYQIGRFLKCSVGKKANDGTDRDLTVFDCMKMAAKDPKTGVSLDSLYDDLYYIDKLTGGTIDMPNYVPESVPKKTRLSGEKNWGKYGLAHLENVPHSVEGKIDCLAKAIVGSYYYMEQNKYGRNVPEFSVKSARKFAEQLKSRPAFKQLCKDPTKVKEVLEAGAKDPSRLHEIAVGFSRPFNVSKVRSDDILKKLKDVLPLLDPPQGRSTEWQRLIQSISSIDLNDPENSGEKKLKEIFERGTAYMKGKKKLRSTEAQQNRFDQAMDIVAAVCEASEYSAYEGNAVIERINEVRLKHDPDYDKVRLVDYGIGKIASLKNVLHYNTHTKKNRTVPSHTNVTDPLKIKAVIDVLDPPDRKIKRRKLAHKSPIRKKSPYPNLPAGTQMLRSSAAKGHFDPFLSSRELSADEAAVQIAEILAYNKAKRYNNPKLSGAGNFVFDQKEYLDQQNQYYKDPAVKQLAGKYKDPKNRLALTAGAKYFDKFDSKALARELDQVKKELEPKANVLQ